MKISKKDIVLIVITVIMLGILVGGFIYDRTPALLDRTNFIDISGDDNLKVSDITKYGFMYNRVAYEAKIEIVDGYWEKYYLLLSNIYENEGQYMNFMEFNKYANQSLSSVSIKPKPSNDSIVWLMGTKLEVDNTQLYKSYANPTESTGRTLNIGGGETSLATSVTTVAESSYRGSTVVYVIDQESDGKAYLYIYYSK